MPWIIGFRHYFGDFESFQNGSNIPFFYDFFLSKNHTTEWFLCNTLLIWSKKFYQFQKIWLLNLKLAWIGSFRFIYGKYIYKYIYEVVPIYWLILTLDSCLREMNQYFLLELHHVRFTSTPQKKWEFYWNRRNDVESRALSFLYNSCIIKNGGCKNPQRIVSFKSHVAFYHIVLNEVLP